MAELAPEIVRSYLIIEAERELNKMLASSVALIKAKQYTPLRPEIYFLATTLGLPPSEITAAFVPEREMDKKIWLNITKVCWLYICGFVYRTMFFEGEDATKNWLKALWDQLDKCEQSNILDATAGTIREFPILDTHHLQVLRGFERQELTVIALRRDILRGTGLDVIPTKPFGLDAFDRRTICPSRHSVLQPVT
jgi:hypothetical protein